MIVSLGIISAYLQASIPFYIRKIINSLNNNQNKEYILLNAFLIFGLGFFHFIVNLFAQRNRAYMNYRIEYEIRNKTFVQILNLDEYFFYKFTNGDIIARLIDDISEKIAWFSCSGVFRCVQAVFTLTAVISVMVYINPLLTAIALFPMPFMVLVIIKLGNSLSKKYDELQKSISNVYDFLEVSFAGIKPIKANLKEKNFSIKFSEVTHNQLEKSIDSERLQVFIHYIFFFSATFGIFLVYLYGGYSALKGKITIGDLVAFQVYVFMIIWPFSDISQFFISAKKASTSVKRVDEIIKFNPSFIDKDSFIKIENIEMIKIEKLDLCIGSKKILDKVHLTAKKNQKIAIVGMIGSSKSTFLKVISRLIPYDCGLFEINGIDVNGISINSYYSNVGYVSQESQIISDTILNNITMYKNYPWEEVEDVIKRVQLDKDIYTMPEGVKTKIGSHGFSLSGGQRQRIALARALIKKPKLLVLDDATNQIDVKTEKKIWNEIEKLDIIIIFVTHRKYLLENADFIYVMDKGRIVEFGSHLSLINSNTLYKKIYMEYK
ncbi:MAG: ABC transporter ATP-binding protein/permease [Candidatus Goldbacteria bacterium]|nr:ABC transporter ATP-binding protein/permease [Candidatus Goldiibacteriota bacterium]